MHTLGQFGLGSGFYGLSWDKTDFILSADLHSPLSPAKLTCPTCECIYTAQEDPTIKLAVCDEQRSSLCEFKGKQKY